MKIDEVCLLTNDVQRLADFYKQILETDNNSNDETHQFILTEGTALTIYNDGTVKNNQNQNICLAFTVEDIYKEYEKAVALGARIIEGPAKRPWGATNMSFYDPDNNVIFFRSFPKNGRMDIHYRRMTPDDLDAFIGMRISQLREEGATEDIDLAPALRDYYVRHMADGTFVAWLALDGSHIIGTSGMSFVEKPPYFGCPNGKIGLLSSMYTDPDYRRRGIAKELLSKVVDEARAYGCGTVQITASDMGVLLYTDFGFVKNGNFMQYKL